MKKKIFVWTHHDLDGLASCLIIKWLFPGAEFEYQTTTAYNFRENFNKWSLKHKLSDYDTVYILDLDVGEHHDLIDFENVYIADHHYTHIEKDNYEFADTMITEYPSTALLLFKTYTKLYKIIFTEAQKLLIALANDHDSYNHTVEESTILDAVFWNTQNNFSTFMELYKDGFNGFTEQQLGIYKIFKTSVEKVIDELKYYEGKAVKIGENFYHVIATFASKHIDKVSDHILNSYKPDIAIVVNLKTKHISFRRKDKANINLGEFAKIIADGGGHAFAAGGTVTDNFLAFTKLLKPRKRPKKIINE